ncbi:unnamed protein product [Mytilus coruscus]|uniref:DUF6589 domain-containing protein n=1 Tax=Mytilus coruscus TaxID=42192 RepID=A0A6J8B771_MYTCO|nr:unnamed protein product [Mytilus coruscus]
MEQHENIIDKTFQDAGVTLTDKTKIHTGGDQLTRERYSGAKVLRAAEANVKHHFGHLGPITFEMFHLVMNFLQVFFDLLYKDKSAGDIGTLKYDHLSQPTKNIPPEFTTKDEKKQWTVDTFGKKVDEFVWPKHKPKNQVADKSVVVDGQFMNLKVRLANGKEVQLSPRLPEKNKETPPETDKVMNCGQMVLELGLLFKELLDVCKSPDQKKLLQLLKHSMTVFKAKSNNSKYAFEIHRFLIQQISTLSEKEAAEVVQGMFVNTTGKPDGHIPADLQMEYVVKTIKKNTLNICIQINLNKT